MRRTNIYLDEGQTRAVQELARMEGISRAELVRRLIDRGVSAMPADLDSDLAAIQESFGVCANEEFPARRPDARAAHLDRLRQR